MKKMGLVISLIMLLLSTSNAFALIQVAAQPKQPYDGHDYIGDIIAAALPNDSGQEILIVTSSASKKNESSLENLTIKINGKDFPFGLTLASLVGKQVQIIFNNTNSNYDIKYVTIITDDYYPPKQ